MRQVGVENYVRAPVNWNSRPAPAICVTAPLLASSQACWMAWAASVAGKIHAGSEDVLSDTGAKNDTLCASYKMSTLFAMLGVARSARMAAVAEVNARIVMK